MSRTLKDLPLWFMLVIGVAVCTTAIFMLPAWHDEAITLLDLAGNGAPAWPEGASTIGAYNALFQGHASFGEMNRQLIETDVHPPLYYHLANLWSLAVGQDIASVRVLSLVFTAGAAVMAVMMLPRAEMSSRYAAGLAFLLSPTAMYAAVNARDYGLALLLVTATIYFAQRAIRAPENAGAPIVLAGLSGSLAFLCHYFTILVTGPVFLLALASFWKTQLRSIAVALGLFALASAANYPFLSVHLGARDGQYAGFGPLASEIAGLATALVGQFSPMTHIQSVAGISTILGAPILAIILLRALLHGKDKEVVFHGAIVAMSCVALLLLFAMTDKSLSVAGPRYAIFMLPSLIYLLARGLTFMAKRGRLLGKVGALAGIAILVAIGSYARVEPFGPAIKPWTTVWIPKAIEQATAGVDTGDILFVTNSPARGLVGRFTPLLHEDVSAFYMTTADGARKATQLALDKQVVIVLTSSVSKIPEETIEMIEVLEQAGFEEVSWGIWKRMNS